jgi:hypothetical protein
LDNTQKKYARIGLRVVAALGFFLGAIAYSNVQLPFFNQYNPLYTPLFWIALGGGLFYASTRFRQTKDTWHTLAFFNSAGLTRVFDIAEKDIHPIYLDYTDSDGHIRSIKHSHPLVIPSEDGFEQIFLVPDTGMEAINPLKTIQKYGVVSMPKKTIDEVNRAINTYNTSIKNIEGVEPMEALNPEFLVRDMTETEDPDTIFQEFKEHLVSISNWSKTKALLRENLFLFIMVGVAGFAIATTIYMVTGFDFRGVVGH